MVIQRDDRKVEFNKLTICESEHSIVSSGNDGRNSDIAAMSDFSDDEDETQVEFRPGPRTGSDRDGSIDEESSLCDRPTVRIPWIRMIRNIGPNSAAFCWMMIAFRIATIRMRSKM